LLEIFNRNKQQMQTITTDRAALDAAIAQVGELIQTTMGPWPHNVTITRKVVQMPDGPRLVPGRSINDGVEIVRTLESDDPMVNLAYERIRRACEATLRETGDGTSSTVVLFSAFTKYLAGMDAKYAHEQFLKDVDTVCDNLKAMAQKLDGSEESLGLLRSVASIAMHGHEWSQGIADLLHDLGLDGSFTIEMAKDGKFSTERLEGFRWGHGVVSPSFFNNPRAGRFECSDAYVAIVAGEITDPADISGILAAYQPHIAKSGMAALPLVIVTQRATGNALAALANAQFAGIQVKAPIVLIGVPNVDDARAQMDDLAAVLGTKVYDKLLGKGAADANITLHDLGRATKVIATDKMTTFASLTPEAATVRAEQVEAQIASGGDEAKLRARISNIRGTFGVIRINVSTETEFDHMKEVVSDGYRAVQSALVHGVLPGAGKAFSESAVEVFGSDLSVCVSDAVKAGFLLLEDDWTTQDVRTGTVGDARELGILDNAGSVISAVRNAAVEAHQLHLSSFFILNK